MSSQKSWITAVFVAAGLVASGVPAFAQSSQPGQSSQSQPAQQPENPAKSGSSLSMTAAQTNEEELASANAFQDMPNTDLPKKILAGEEFLKKYPDSQYRPLVYSILAQE